MAEEGAFKRRRADGGCGSIGRSGSGSGSGSPRAALAACHDPSSAEPIDVDVGGTRFRASRATLVNASTYFESLLSERWRAEGRGGEGKESDDDEGMGSRGGGGGAGGRGRAGRGRGSSSTTPPAIFVDQCPQAFELLLSYMRSGVTYLPRDDPYLCEKTLMLAEYLGVHGFLVSIKAVTMKNVSRREDYLSDEASEAAQFDVRFGSLRHAVDKGILPVCYFPPSDELRIKVSDRVFHASKKVLTEKSGYFSRFLASSPEDYWKEEYVSGENPDVMEVALQMMSSPNSAFTTMTEKFHSVSGQNVKFRHFYVQAILTWLDKLQLPVDFRDNCVQTITHTFNA
ncbi:hypothetical protein ACHAWF_003738 [Thalassiosira exigua]